MLINKAYADDNEAVTIQGTNDLPSAPEPIRSDWISSVVPMVLIFVVFYFLLIRPQEKRKRQQAELIRGVKKGEEVLTNSGIFGTITAIDDNSNTVEIAIAKDVNVKVLKSAILDITSRSTSEIVQKGSKKDKGKSGAKTS